MHVQSEHLINVEFLVFTVRAITVINTLPITNCSRKSQNERKYDIRMEFFWTFCKVRWLINGFAFLSLETPPQNDKSSPEILYPLLHFTAPVVAGWNDSSSPAPPVCKPHTSSEGIITSHSRHWSSASCLCLLASQVKAKEGMLGKPRFLGLPAPRRLSYWCEHPKNSRPWSICGSERFHCMRKARGVDQCFSVCGP